MFSHGPPAGTEVLREGAVPQTIVFQGPPMGTCEAHRCGDMERMALPRLARLHRDHGDHRHARYTLVAGSVPDSQNLPPFRGSCSSMYWLSCLKHVHVGKLPPTTARCWSRADIPG